MVSSGEEASSVSPSHSEQLDLTSTADSSSTHSSAEFSSMSVNSDSLSDSFSSFMSEQSAVSSIGGDASSVSPSRSEQTADASSVSPSRSEQTADASSVSPSRSEQTADASSISASGSEQTADASSISASGSEQTSDASSISASGSEQTADVVGSLSGQSDVSGFSESSIQPSMTSNLDSKTFVSGSSVTLMSTESLPDAAFQTKSVLTGSSLTLSDLAVTESSSGVEQTAFSDVSSFNLKSTDVITSDVTSTNELSSFNSLSAIDKFSPTSTTELVSSLSSPEVIHPSSFSERTATEMSSSILQTISNIPSSSSETRTSDLGVESTAYGEVSSLEATATTKTVDESFSGIPRESSLLTQTTLHDMTTTVMQELSSVRASLTSATTIDIHGSSNMGQGSMSQSLGTAQSHSLEMSDMSSESNFLSFTETASSPESFISQASSLASEIQSSSDMVTSLVSSDHGIIKSTVSSDTLLSMAGSDTASSEDFHLSSSFKESREETASLMTSFVSETPLEASHTIFSVQSTAESAGFTVSQESPSSAVAMVSSIVDTQSNANSVMTSKLFSESSVSLASVKSTHLISPSVSGSYKATDIVHSSQETKTLSATSSKDKLQDSSSYSIPVSLTNFASLGSSSGSSLTISFFSSEAKSSISHLASVTVPTKSPETAPLQTTEMVTQSAVFSSIQSAMSSPIQSAMSSPIQSAMSSPMSSPIQSAMSSPIQSAMSSPMQSAMSSPIQSAMSSPIQSAMSSPMQSAMSSPIQSAMSSPIQSAMSSPIQSAMSSPIQSAMSSPMFSPIQSALSSPIQSAMSSPMSSLMSSLIQSAMSSPIQSAMSSPMSSPIQSAMSSPIQSAMSSPMSSPIQSAMSSPIQSAMSSPIQSAMSSPIQSAMSSPIQSAMSSPIQSAMSSPMSSPIQSAMSSPMSSPIQSAMSSPIQSAMSSPMSSPIQSAMSSPMFSPIQSAMSSPMSSPIQSAMSSPIQSAMSSPIQSAMFSPIQSAMSSPMFSPIQSAMSSPMFSPIQSEMSSSTQSAMSSPTQSIISSPLVADQTHIPLVSSLASFQSVESVLSSSSTVSRASAVQSSAAWSGYSNGVSLTVSSVSYPYVTSSEILSSHESVFPGHTAFVSSQSMTDTRVFSTETFVLSTQSSKSSDVSLSSFATNTISGDILSSHTVNTESLMSGITSAGLGSNTMSVLTDSSVFNTETVLGSKEFNSQIFSSSLETRGIVSSVTLSSEGSGVSYLSESNFPTPELSSMKFSGTSEPVTMSMGSIVTNTDYSGVLSSQSSGLFSFTAGVSVLPSEMFTTVTSVVQPQSQSEFNRSALSSVDYSDPSPSMISTESLLTVSHSELFTTSDYNVKSSGISSDIFTVSSYTPATIIDTESMLPTKASFISASPSSFESISSFSFGMHTFTSAVSDSLFNNASTPMSYVMPSSHSVTGSGFIPVDTSYITPLDSSVFQSEHSMITSSMQISETETRSSMLFPSSAVPQTSQSSMYFTQSGESTLTVMVPSQSMTLDFSSPSVTAVITPVPSLLPSSDTHFSSDFLFSSVLNQTAMLSSEGLPTAMLPSGTFMSGSESHSGTSFVSIYSSEMFQSTFPSFSTPIQTDLSRSEMSFSESTPLTSFSFPPFVSLTAVQSSFSTQSLPLPNASSVTTLFSESVEGSQTLTDVLATSNFSTPEMFTSSVSRPGSSSVPSMSFTDLTATGSSLLFPSGTVAVSTASHLLTSGSEMKTPSLSVKLSSTETPFVPSVETYSTNFIPMPSFSTSFFSGESIAASTLAVQSVLSSAVVTPVQSVPGSQSDTFMTVPSQSSASTPSATSEPSTPILPFESVSSAGVSSLSMSAPSSMTDFGPTFSSSEIMTSSVSSLNATEMLPSSRLLTTQQPFSDMSLFTSLSEELMATTVTTEVSFTVTTATLFTSTEIPVTQVESSMQTTVASGLQSNLPNTTSLVTLTTIKPSSEAVVTSVPESLFSSLSSESFMSEVSEHSSTLVSLPTATIIPTASTVDVSAEMSSLTMVMDTSTVLETSMETSGFVTTPVSASSQRLTSEMSSFLVDSTSEMSTSVLPSSQISSSLNVISSHIESTSEILPLTSSEVMSSQSTSSVHLVTTSDTVLLPSSQEEISSATVSDSVAVSSEFSLLSSSLETVSSSEISSAFEVTTSVVLQPSSLSSDISSSETSTSTSISSSVLETSSAIIPTPSFSSSIASSSLSPVPTTSTTTESATTTTTTEPTTTQSTTNAPTTVPENLLVMTVIQRRPTDDIQSQAFISDMERGLASAYDLAFQRQRDGGSARRKRSTLWLSSVLPRWTGSAAGRRRRRRAAVVNDVEVQMREVKTQTATPNNAELIYTVREKGQAVPAQTATQALDTLQVQEVALELNRIVITKAQPAGQTGASTGEDDPKLWIIGAVLGPVVLIVLVWVVVCLLIRYRANHTDKLRIETNQSQLLTAKHGGHSREGEVAEDPEYAQATLTQTNGLSKSSPHKTKYEVSTDPDTTATSTGKDDSSATPTKRGRKLPKKKASLRVAEDTEGEQSSEKVDERSTPPKKKNAKKSSFKETEEMEMNTLDPGFYNSATLQATRQLYAQQTFEEEDEEFLDSVEEERRKNKQRQRLKKKQGNSAAAQAPNVDTMQAAYERAQQEIDKVLGPRQNHAANGVPGTSAADPQKQRSKRRSRRGQTNEAYSHDDPPPPAPVLQPSDSLDEMKSRVHALLDDAFSLLSNSYTSMGSAVSERSRSFKRNKVAPASPSKQGPSDEAVKESQPPLAQSPPPANMPAVEEVLDRSMAPKPGEKLHTPLLVDRTYTDYDPDGLITWSPYRAADESARIVLPEAQIPSTKAPAQEKLQTTIFMESATGNGPHHHYTTQPSSQPLVIRTRQPPVSSTPPKTDPPHSTTKQDRRMEKSVTPLGVTAESDMSYTPYPGLEAYENMLADATTTTTHLTANPSTAEDSARHGDHTMNGDAHEPEPDPPTHKPPTRDVGTRDERDFISSSVGTGNSAKDLVDSIRQELQSLSHKLPPEDVSKTKRDKLAKSDSINNHQGVANGVSKPFKKPRKSSYLDST